MIQKFVVMKSFENFVRGDMISDPAKIRSIVASDHIRFVRPISPPTSGKV